MPSTTMVLAIGLALTPTQFGSLATEVYLNSDGPPIENSIPKQEIEKLR
jgi:hypothetical protein